MERGFKAREVRAAVMECKEVVKANLLPLFDFVAKMTADIWTAWMRDLDQEGGSAMKKKKKVVVTKRRRNKPAGPTRCKKQKHVALFIPSL